MEDGYELVAGDIVSSVWLQGHQLLHGPWDRTSSILSGFAVKYLGADIERDTTALLPFIARNLSAGAHALMRDIKSYIDSTISDSRFHEWVQDSLGAVVSTDMLSMQKAAAARLGIPELNSGSTTYLYGNMLGADFMGEDGKLENKLGISRDLDRLLALHYAKLIHTKLSSSGAHASQMQLVQPLLVPLPEYLQAASIQAQQSFEYSAHVFLSTLRRLYCFGLVLEPSALLNEIAGWRDETWLAKRSDPRFARLRLILLALFGRAQAEQRAGGTLVPGTRHFVGLLERICNVLAPGKHERHGISLWKE